MTLRESWSCLTGFANHLGRFWTSWRRHVRADLPLPQSTIRALHSFTCLTLERSLVFKAQRYSVIHFNWSFQSIEAARRHNHCLEQPILKVWLGPWLSFTGPEVLVQSFTTRSSNDLSSDQTGPRRDTKSNLNPGLHHFLLLAGAIELVYCLNRQTLGVPKTVVLCVTLQWQLEYNECIFRSKSWKKSTAWRLLRKSASDRTMTVMIWMWQIASACAPNYQEMH